MERTRLLFHIRVGDEINQIVELPEEIPYTFLDINKESSAPYILEQIAVAINVRLKNGQDEIPFVAPKDFDEWRATELL